MSVPWVDKYRPHKLQNIVHQTELMKTLTNAIKTGNLPHLLFHGSPGTGKTTTILALAYELFGPEKYRERVLELNASDDRGINVVREKIITFSRNIVGNPDPNYPCPPFKILILDEADAMTMDAQSALRKVMEETSSITRFCIICNYVDKIIDPIVSRCMKFKFQSISDEVMIKRLKLIARNEKMTLNDDVYQAIVKIVDGDLRRGIMLLQNIKYIYNINKSITSADVYDLDGRVPEERVTKLIHKCITSEMKDIVIIAKDFYALGYPIKGLCEQLSVNVVHMTDIDDSKKVIILRELSKTCQLLSDNSTELLQLIRILMVINDTMNK